MAERLDGTVALVTGASSGIGAVTAAALAAQGASVALVARRKDRLETLAAGIRERGGTVLVLESDITDERQATEAVERTVAELGRLDTLVNNAGVMLLGPAVGAPLSEWQRTVEITVLGLLYCAHAALPHLLRAADDSPRRVADMVNISSTAGRFAHGGMAVYNAMKHSRGRSQPAQRARLIGIGPRQPARREGRFSTGTLSAPYGGERTSLAVPRRGSRGSRRVGACCVH